MFQEDISGIKRNNNGTAQKLLLGFYIWDANSNTLRIFFQ